MKNIYSGAEKRNNASVMLTGVVKELRKRTMVVTGSKSLVTGSWQADAASCTMDQ